MGKMTMKEKIVSNLVVHGIYYAAKICRRAGVNFDTFYFCIFGRYPTR